MAVNNDLNRKENVKIPFGESHHKFIDNLCGWNCRSYGNIIREIAFTSKKPDASGIIEAYDELSESDGNIYFKESGVRLQLTARKKTVNHDKLTEITNQDAHSLYFSAPVTEELDKECNREVSLDLLDSFNARSIMAETVRLNEPEKFSADSGNTLSLLFPDGRLQAHG